MHVVVSQEDLAHGLQIVSRAVASKTTLPVLSGILLEGRGQTLHLAASDLEISIEYQVAANIKTEGAVVLPARYFSELIYRIPAEDVEVEVDTGNCTAQVRWERSEYTIHGLPPDQFPVLPNAETQPPVLAVQKRLFRKMVRQTVFAVGTDETRPMLMGVLFEVEGPALTMVATDGVRLACAQGPLDTEPAGSRKFVVAGRAMGELQRLLSSAREETITAFCSDNHVAFRFDGILVTTRLLEGQFPDYQLVIPRTFMTVLRVKRAEFQAACERASLISRKDGISPIRISLSPQGTVVTSHVPEVGKVREEIPATVEGEDLEIAFNARYLTEGLRVVDQDEVVLSFTGPRKAASLAPADDESFLYIVLPLTSV